MPSTLPQLSAPVNQRHFDSLAEDADPGVSDHHVQRPEASLGGLDHSRPAFFDADVLMQEDRLAARISDLVQ
jgi:hypothetical protein